MQRTACIIKPDAFPSLTGEIITRILGAGFTIDIAGTFRFDQLMVDQFYNEHVGKHYYDNLSRFMLSAPVLGMVLERVAAINTLRNLMGPATIELREPGQIRFDLGDKNHVERNCIHGSDSEYSARYEIDLLTEFII